MLFEEARVDYHFTVWEWLLSNLGGIEGLRSRHLVLPSLDYFPFRPAKDHPYAEALFLQTKRLMGIESWPCDLRAMPSDPSVERQPIEGHTVGAAGTFQWPDGDDHPIIQYHPSGLGDGPGLVAVLAHELCHYLLFTVTNEPPGGWNLHEIHTDIAASFMGFGVFQANSSFHFAQWTDGNWAGWSARTLGYLSDAEHAYALAVFCRLTEADPAPVRDHLKLNPRTYFQLALEDLEQREDWISRLKSITGPALPQQPKRATWEEKDIVQLQKPKVECPTLTLEEIKSLTFRHPNHERLLAFYDELVASMDEPDAFAAETRALEALPERLRSIVLVCRFLALQEVLGLQGAVLLDIDEPEVPSEQMLAITADAFEKLGQRDSARFLISLIPGIRQHLDLLDAALANDSLDEFVSPLDRDDHWLALSSGYVASLQMEITTRPEELIFPPVRAVESVA